MSNPGVVLDTHSWIWWVNDSKELSKTAKQAIDRAITGKSVYLSAISAWEVAVLVERGRLKLTMNVEDWIARSEALPFVNIIPVDVAIAVKSVLLSDYAHKDPADRIIMATALRFGLPIVTCDENIRNYLGVGTIW